MNTVTFDKVKISHSNYHCENPVLCSALLLSEICLLTEFQVDTFNCSYIMSRAKFSVKINRGQ